MLLYGTDKSKDTLMQTARKMCSICNAGYTFEEARRLIYISWLNHSQPHPKFYGTKHENIIKQSVYYHRELRIKPEPKLVDVDYEKGEIVSLNENKEFFVEMVASYTMNDLIEFLYKTDMVDRQQFPEPRIKGLLKYYINQYGLEKTLFLIDAASDSRENMHQKIMLNEIDKYMNTAKRYQDTLKNNCDSVGGNIICPKTRFRTA